MKIVFKKNRNFLTILSKHFRFQTLNQLVLNMSYVSKCDEMKNIAIFEFINVKMLKME